MVDTTGVIILGIDPGLRRTGYALVEFQSRTGSEQPAGLVEAGLFTLDASSPVADRLVELERDLDLLFQRFPVGTLAVEKVFAHYAHPRTAIAMAHARGVILLVAARRGVTIVETPSTEVKKSITGNGHASKAQVQGAVSLLLGLASPPEPSDVADAIAIALCAGWRISLAGR